MLTFAWYLLKVVLVSGILFSYYWIALRNKKFHHYNRFYLLTAIVLSWVIPILKINIWEDLQQPQVVKLLTVVANGNLYVEEATKFKWDWNFAIILVMLTISALFLVRFIIAIVKIKTLISKNPAKKWNDTYFVFTNAEGTPFSFFSYIFWNNQINLNSPEGEQILKHEVAHVQEKHSLDKLFLHVLLIIHWYNPFLWLIRKELDIIHEFIADEKAIDEGDTSAFATMLLQTAYPAHSSMFINSFFHSPIKRRLLMLTSSKRTSFTYVRRIALLPLLMSTCLLFAFSFKKKKMSFKSDQTAASRTAGNKQGQNLPYSSENLIDANLQDTTKKKNTVTQVMNVTFRDSTGNKSTIPASVTFTSKDTGKLKRQLVVLDGKEMSWQEFEKKGVKPEEIQSMNVLKDKSATDKYGDKGKDGVIEITSKQSSEQTKSNNTDAEFPDGADAWRRYLEKNLDASVPKKNHAPQGDYPVVLEFDVDRNGSISNIHSISKNGYGTEDEAIKMIEKGPKWVPAKKNGSFVASTVRQTITFRVSE